MIFPKPNPITHRKGRISGNGSVALAPLYVKLYIRPLEKLQFARFFAHAFVERINFTVYPSCQGLGDLMRNNISPELPTLLWPGNGNPGVPMS